MRRAASGTRRVSHILSPAWAPGIEERLDFPDHAAYGKEELHRILSALERSGADLIVTTEKDAVKLSPLTGDSRFRVLGVRMEIRDGEELARLILEAVR